VVTAAGIKDVTSTTGVVKLKVIFMNTAVACLNIILTVTITVLTRNAYALKIEDIGSVKLRFNNSNGQVCSLAFSANARKVCNN